jgi:uroporphyrinogen-III synthase
MKFMMFSGDRQFTMTITISLLAENEATADAARALGFEVRSASGDVTALGALIRNEALQHRLLHVSGMHRAGTLPDTVTSISAYDQVPIPLNAEASRLLAGSQEVAIPLFSPRTAELYQACLESGWARCGHAICISANAARPLEKHRFKSIRVCAEPTAQAMIDAIAEVVAPPPA